MSLYPSASDHHLLAFHSVTEGNQGFSILLSQQVREPQEVRAWIKKEDMQQTNDIDKLISRQENRGHL